MVNDTTRTHSTPCSTGSSTVTKDCSAIRQSARTWHMCVMARLKHAPCTSHKIYTKEGWVCQCCMVSGQRGAPLTWRTAAPPPQPSSRGPLLTNECGNLALVRHAPQDEVGHRACIRGRRGYQSARAAQKKKDKAPPTRLEIRVIRNAPRLLFPLLARLGKSKGMVPPHLQTALS
jgi:hypothetical protein